MKFVQYLGTVVGVPLLLAVCAVVVFMAVLLLIWDVARRTVGGAEPADYKSLLGLAHFISAVSGLLPWGRPASPPALPQPPADQPEQGAGPTVNLVRGEVIDPASGGSTGTGPLVRRVEP